MEKTIIQGDGVHHRSKNALLQPLKAGDAAAWREILSDYGPRLLAYATRMLGDRATAEEVLQDSLMNIIRTIDRFDGRCSLKSWLFRVVHNSAIDEIRRRKRYVPLSAEAQDDYFNTAGRWKNDCPGWDGLVAKNIDEKRLLNLVREKMNHLPHSHREVLLMKEVEGMNTAEICSALDISPGNLRIRIHRARAALRAAVVGDAL